MAENERLAWDVIGFLRFRNHVSEAYDMAIGSVLRVPIGSRVNLGGGYLRRRVNQGKGPVPEDRFIIIPSVLVASHPLDVRSFTYYERIFGTPGRADYNRYRERIELEQTRRGLSPTFSEELAWRREGLIRSRTFAGVRFPIHPHCWLEVGYQGESLKTGTHWLPRHSIRTTINVTRKPG